MSAITNEQKEAIGSMIKPLNFLIGEAQQLALTLQNEVHTSDDINAASERFLATIEYFQPTFRIGTASAYSKIKLDEIKR